MSFDSQISVSSSLNRDFSVSDFTGEEFLSSLTSGSGHIAEEDSSQTLAQAKHSLQAIFYKIKDHQDRSAVQKNVSWSCLVSLLERCGTVVSMRFNLEKNVIESLGGHGCYREALENENFIIKLKKVVQDQTTLDFLRNLQKFEFFVSKYATKIRYDQIKTFIKLVDKMRSKIKFCISDSELHLVLKLRQIDPEILRVLRFCRETLETSETTETTQSWQL